MTAKWTHEPLPIPDAECFTGSAVMGLVYAAVMVLILVSVLLLAGVHL